MSYIQDLLGENYKEDMSEEELSTALQNIMQTTNESNLSELTTLKNRLSKANSEAADYKKQLRSKLSEEEAKEAAQKEEWEQIRKENADLKKSIELADKKTKLIGMGYDEKLADSTATAMVEGDLDTLMSNQAKYLETQKKNISVELMKQTPRPAAGVDNPGVDYEAKIQEAKDNGDISSVAYYTRLQAQESAEDKLDE